MEQYINCLSTKRTIGGPFGCILCKIVIKDDWLERTRNRTAYQAPQTFNRPY